jgi:hypothetical protein
LTGESPQSTAVAESSATIASVGALRGVAQSLPLTPPTLAGVPHARAYHPQATDYLALLRDDTDEKNS